MYKRKTLTNGTDRLRRWGDSRTRIAVPGSTPFACLFHQEKDTLQTPRLRTLILVLLYALWVLAIVGFAVLHAWHLGADLPNGSPWTFDWAKYTDEGWYASAAVRAHLFGSWYVPGDFNPATAVPVWPFAEWVLFFFTGVTVEAARGLAVACFFANLALSYLLLRARGLRFPVSDPTDEDQSAGAPVSQPTDKDLSAGAPVWVALVAVTLAATSPFLYCFSRLAILEPLQTVLTLAALNLAVRLPAMRRPVLVSAGIGLLFALMTLTKTTAVFLAPAVGWAIVMPLWSRRRLAARCALSAACAAAAVYGLWMALITSLGLLGDYKYYFFVNAYPKPAEFYWPLLAFWWSFHGLLWVDHSLILLAVAIVLGAAIRWRKQWGRKLWRDPIFGASLWAVAGYVLFMSMQNHPQPRYFAMPAFFCFFVVALGAGALLSRADRAIWARRLGWATVAIAVAAAGVHGARTIGYATHPQYTWVNAAGQLARYIDTHPNGKPLLVSISGDDITLVTHLPTLCDDFGTENLPSKMAAYQPGWYAAWNDIDPGTLADLHTHFSLEQAASFAAFDDPERNHLVLFKLHPLPRGRVRDEGDHDLRVALPGDKFDIPIE